jgi:hypothetical protein
LALATEKLQLNVTFKFIYLITVFCCWPEVIDEVNAGWPIAAGQVSTLVDIHLTVAALVARLTDAPASKGHGVRAEG